MKEKGLRLAKRGLVYITGLFIMAIGVVFSVRSALGVSPVTCLANVVHQISALDLGLCTTGVYCLYILAELLILRRDFKATMLLQILASLFFGSLVSLATRLFAFLPQPESYIAQLAYLLGSIPLVAFGVMLYLSPQILPTPGEGLSLAVSQKTGRTVASCKMITDCCMVLASAAVSLLYFRRFVGVREGTLISALLVGFVMKRFMALCQGPLLRFVERDTPLQRAMGEETLPTAPGKRLILSISREFGSEGYEIGRLLAERLDVPFFDEALDQLVAKESGLSAQFIAQHERLMGRGILYDFVTAGYAMYNGALSPLEQLFAAQTRVIRRVAAENPRCVIVGKCSDHILYNDPDSFRIFIHARPEHRARVLSRRLGVSRETALRRMAETDAARGRYYSSFTGREWGNMKYYNLAIDSGVFTVEQSVTLIEEAIRLREASRA